MKQKFYKFKNTPILLVFLVAGLFSGDFKIEPVGYFNYNSNGGVWHHKEEGAVSFFGIGAKALKSIQHFTFEGQFIYNSAHNVSKEAFLFSRNQGIEFPAGYTFGEGFWYEYSTMKITYSTENALFEFGKFNRFWGPGTYPLTVSNKPPSYPQFAFEWQITPLLKLQYFHGALKSGIEDLTRSEYYENVGERKYDLPRSIAGHRLEWAPFSRVTFGATETVIYGVRALDVHYLMPFIPFWSLQHYLGDTDNIQMSGDISLNFENGNLYAVLFIDEWRPEWTFKAKNRNWFAWQFGYSQTGIFKKSDRVQAEFTWLDHRIYRHRFPINDYYSHGYPLGFWAGPHAQELYLHYYTSFEKYNLNMNYSNAIRGELTGEMLTGQYNDVPYERFSGKTENRRVLGFSISRSVLKNQIKLETGIEYIRWRNPGFDPFEPDQPTLENIEKWSMSIGIYYNF